MTDPATAYAEAVVAGEILTGELVRLACERHLRNLDEQEVKGWFWDVVAIEDFLHFAGLHHHYKGRWAKEPCTCDTDPMQCRKRFVLLPWQEFCGGSIVGWKRRNEDGVLVRRFDTATIEMARGNGKTHFAAPVLNYLTFCDGEAGAESYVAAAAGHQARYVHDVLKQVVRASPNLRDTLLGWDQKLANIHNAGNRSFIQPVSSESKNLDALAPHVILLDELHAHQDASVRDALRTGTTKRDQSLTLQISTAGEEREDSVMKSERDYVEQVLRQELDDEAVFGFICELDKGDDWRDAKNTCYKSNPSLGAAVRLEDLEKKINEAIFKPLIRDQVMIKNQNMWLTVFAGMFNAEEWRSCNGKLDMKALRKRQCFAGIDLAESIDMSALALVFPPEDDDLWRVLMHYWLPAATVERKAIRDKPIKRWVEQGLIEVAGDRKMDFHFIQARLEELSKRYVIAEVGFDRHRATPLINDLELAGFPVVDVPYGPTTLGVVTDFLVGLVAAGQIVYDDHPVLRWNAKHCVARTDSGGNSIPGKKCSRGNIDGISATIIAMSRALAGTVPASIYNPGAPATGRSVYNE